MKPRTATLAAGLLQLVALAAVAEADTDAGDGKCSFSGPRPPAFPKCILAAKV
jgi:hypothetical protein